MPSSLKIRGDIKNAMVKLYKKGDKTVKLKSIKRSLKAEGVECSIFRIKQCFQSLGILHNKKYAKVESLKKTYYQRNKELINEKRREKINCECGSVISRDNKYRHLKTRKHLLFFEETKK